MRRQDDHQLGSNQLFELALEKQSEKRNIAKQRHLVFAILIGFADQSTNDNGLPVPNGHGRVGGPLINPWREDVVRLLILFLRKL